MYRLRNVPREGWGKDSNPRYQRGNCLETTKGTADQGIERLFTEASELARRFFMRKASRACDCLRGRGTSGVDYANEKGPDQ